VTCLVMATVRWQLCTQPLCLTDHLSCAMHPQSMYGAGTELNHSYKLFVRPNTPVGSHCAHRKEAGCNMRRHGSSTTQVVQVHHQAVTQLQWQGWHLTFTSSRTEAAAGTCNTL
jgi:hypothetical protein